MAFTNIYEYINGLKRHLYQPLISSGTHGVAARANDMYRMFFTANATTPQAAIPSTQVACSRATDGALNFQVPNGGVNRLMVTGFQLNATASGMYVLIDRLSHQGGLSGTSTAGQTTNLPTAALTRYTDGVGVMLGLSIYTQIGTTAGTVVASYTNQNGTSGQTTTAVAYGGTGFREANRMLLLPLASGDTGVRAVASVTASVNTTTAGNYGVTLFRPLALVCIENLTMNFVGDLVNGNFIGGLPEILDDACLGLLAFPTSTTGTFAGSMLLAEK